MENMDIIMTFINGVGFPIACVCAMFAMWNKERGDHRAEVAELTAAVQNNTRVIDALISKLDGMKLSA